MNLIVAVDQNWAIGYQNKLLARVSADLKRFKALTMGHPVVLGRKTLETFPGGRPLPGRRNLILSRNPDFRVEGAEVYHSLEELIKICPEDAFIIGGSQIYRALNFFCDTAYVTKLRAAFPADAWFHNLDADPDWILTETEEPLTENGLTFQYCTYRRKK